MRHLKDAGYTTAMIGKHHYLDRHGLHMDVTTDEPTIRDYGFDHVVDDDENLHNDDAYTPEQGGTTHLFNLNGDPFEGENLVGRPGYETVTRDLLAELLSVRIRTTPYTHLKEEKRLQQVRVGW